jgi:hypothetical protein
MSTSNVLKLPPVGALKPSSSTAEGRSEDKAAYVPTAGLRRASESSAVSATGVSESFSRRTSVEQAATGSPAQATRVIEPMLLQNPAYEDALNMLRPVVGDLLSAFSPDTLGRVDARLAATTLDMQVAPLLKGIATLDPLADHIAMTSLVQTHLKSLGATQLDALGRGISVSRQDGLLASYSDITANLQILVNASLAARIANGASEERALPTVTLSD